jgi:hypothetical protein
MHPARNCETHSVFSGSSSCVKSSLSSSNSERGVQHCATRFANVFLHCLHCISALCKCVFVLLVIASLVWATVFLCCLHCVSTISKCISPLSALHLHYVQMYFTIVYITSLLWANVFHHFLHCISTMCKRFSSLSALHLHWVVQMCFCIVCIAILKISS